MNTISNLIINTAFIKSNEFLSDTNNSKILLFPYC